MRVAGGAQQRQQPGSEREVPEVVRAKLQLEAVGGGIARRRRHHTRIIDEQVNRPTGSVQARGKIANRREIRQVNQFQAKLCMRVLCAQLRNRLLAFGRVAHCQNNFCPGSRQPPCDAKAKPTVRPGDDRQFAMQIGNRDVVRAAHYCVSLLV